MLINILEYLEKSAKKYPDKNAFSDQENQIAFNELWYQAKAIGCQLAAIMKNKQKLPIAVFTERNINSIIYF